MPAVENPVDYIRENLNKHNKTLARETGETLYFVMVVREQTKKKTLQRGHRASDKWHEQDKKAHNVA